jgi:hypothetical protein
MIIGLPLASFTRGTTEMFWRIRSLRRLMLAIALVAACAMAAALAPIGAFWLRVQHIKAKPSAGYHADFFVYVSPGALRQARAGRVVTLLVQPNNSGVNSDDAAVHRSDAWWTCFGRKGIADELGVVLLVPAFKRPARDWQIYTHAIDRDTLTTTQSELARPDVQLLAMIDHIRSSLDEEGIKIDDKFLLQGYSASGMFANRFTALHPQRVKAVSAGSPGGWPIAPNGELDGIVLPYPAGVADFTELTGKPFDLEAWRTVPQLIVMGSLDDNDSLDFADGWDPPAAAVVNRLFGDDPQSRWEDAKRLYRQAGADAQFLLVDGVGHDRRALQVHTTRFFAQILTRD